MSDSGEVGCENPKETLLNANAYAFLTVCSTFITIVFKLIISN